MLQRHNAIRSQRLTMKRTPPIWWMDGMIKAGNDGKAKQPAFSHFCLKCGEMSWM